MVHVLFLVVYETMEKAKPLQAPATGTPRSGRTPALPLRQTGGEREVVTVTSPLGDKAWDVAEGSCDALGRWIGALLYLHGRGFRR